MRYFGAVLLLVFSSSYAGDERPTGKNCDLSRPPVSAGESSNHGLLGIYPRAKDINAGYSGCQLMFGLDQDKWILMFLIEIVDGDPVRVWWEGDDRAPLACRYKNGKIVTGDAKTCESIPTLMKSMAPGCTRAIGEWLDKDAASRGPQPAGCSWE